MKDALTDLIKFTKKLRIAQTGFRMTLKEAYPYLEKTDVNDLLRNISTELDLLLSSSVISKSARIEIPAESSYKKAVVLTRNPGLKRPHEHCSAVEFHTIYGLDENGNIYNEVKEEKISLSVLKGNEQIKQDKLNNFWLYLRKLCGIRDIAKTLIESDFYDLEDLIKDKGVYFQLKDSFIVILSRHFIIEMKGKNKNEYSQKLNSEDLGEYSEEEKQWGSYPSVKSLENFLYSFEELDEILQGLEKRKGKIVRELKTLLSNLQEENKSYKIVQKLLKKT